MGLGSKALMGTSRENVQKVGSFGEKFKNKEQGQIKIIQATFDAKKQNALLSIFFAQNCLIWNNLSSDSKS